MKTFHLLMGCAVFLAGAALADEAPGGEPFRKPVPRYSREETLRTEFSTLRYLSSYVEPSPQKDEIARLMAEGEAAYAAGDLDRVAEAFEQAREVMKNAPMKGGIPSPRGELGKAIAAYDGDDSSLYSKADEVVTRIVASQHLVKGSEFYGGYFYPQYVDFPPGYDMFLLPAFAYLGKHGRDKMAPEVYAKMTASFDAVLQGLVENFCQDKEQVRLIGHTNYYLMYLEGLMLLGEVRGHEEATAKAYEAFDTWTDYVTHNAVTEFNAPTYYGVNINSLQRIYRDTDNPRARAQAKACLDLFFLDLATHYWPERRWLAGANGRCYATLGGLGGVGRFLENYFGPEPYRAPDRSRIKAETPMYEMPDAFRGLALDKSERLLFRAQWGPQYGQDRTTLLTRDFALGTSGCEYGSQDRTLVIDLHSDKPITQIVFVLDTTGDPYRLPERGGWSGTNHDPVGVSCLQHKGAALWLGDLDFKDAKVRRAYVAPTLAIPANMDRLQVNRDEVVERSGGTSVDLASGDALFITEGRATVAVRPWAAMPLADKAPVHRLIFEDEVLVRELDPENAERGGGKMLPMARLATVLHDGEDRTFDRDNVLFGYAVAVHAGDGASREAFVDAVLESEPSFRPYGESASVVWNFNGNRLGLERDPTTNRMLNRWVNTRHVAPPVFHSDVFNLAEDSTVSVHLPGGPYTFKLTP